MRIEKLAEAAPELKYLLEGKASTAKHEPNGASSAKAKRNKWKQESNQLRQALNNTKKGNSTKGKVVGAPPTNATAEVVPENTPVTIASGSGSDDASDVGFPVETAADGLTPCPHCNRRFNERAHERHVPQCLNIRAKPRALKKNTGKMAVATALPPKTKGKVTRML